MDQISNDWEAIREYYSEIIKSWQNNDTVSATIRQYDDIHGETRPSLRQLADEKMGAGGARAGEFEGLGDCRAGAEKSE